MTSGWTLLPKSAITLAYTHEDFGEHRAVSGYGSRWNTACDRLAEPLPPDGIPIGSPSLKRCKACFPTPPPELLARLENGAE